MGHGSNVRCDKYGYTPELLFGVGGQIGMVGQPVWTVACKTARRLIDVWAPDWTETDVAGANEQSLPNDAESLLDLGVLGKKRVEITMGEISRAGAGAGLDPLD